MTPTNEQRDERFEKANETIKYLYASEESGRVLSDLFNATDLSRVLYRDYAILVGDIILGFYQRSDLPKLLTEKLRILPSQAASLSAALEQHLSPSVYEPFTLTPPVASSFQEKNVSTEATDRQGPASKAPASQEGVEQSLQAIERLRTMQGDAERIHGYGAYRRRNEPQSNQPQSKTQPLATPPQYLETDEGQK